MNIQSEKVELIRLITDIKSEKILKKVREVLVPSKKSDSANIAPAMAKRLNESRKQIKEGKGVKVTLDEIWK
jgi:hypothetical protein